MRKIYFNIFVLLFIVTSLAGCKLDAPVYPDGNTGTVGGTGAGLVDNGSTITYNLNGTTTALHFAALQVIAPDPQTIPDGSTQILGGTTTTGVFSLFFSGYQAGTYDIDLLYLNGMLGDNGKVIVTELKTTSADGLHGTIKGTFTTDLIDVTNGATITGVTGSFNVTM